MLFYILLAVALFGALAYAVVENGRGTANTLSADKARTIAMDLIQYGDSLRPKIDRMMLLGGVSDTDSPAGTGILFDPPDSGSPPLTRELFEPAGGHAPYETPPGDACLSTCSYVFTGQITMTGAGTSAPELSMILVDVPQEVCAMINTVLGYGSAIPTGPALTTVTPFNGTNYGAATAVTLSPGTTGVRELCYQESSGAGRYIYVNVVRAR